MYIHVANASVPTISVAAAMAKTMRLSRLGRRIGHISANEVDFMIRTKRAIYECDGVGLIVYKVAAMFKPPGQEIRWSAARYSSGVLTLMKNRSASRKLANSAKLISRVETRE